MIYYDNQGVRSAIPMQENIRLRVTFDSPITDETVNRMLKAVFRTKGEALPNGPPPDLSHPVGDFEHGAKEDLWRKHGSSEWKKAREIDEPIELSRDGNGKMIYAFSKPVTMPKPTYSPDPVYPESERKQKHAGIAVLRIVVGNDGRADIIQAVRADYPGLMFPAIVAVSLWKFEPAKLQGQDVATQIGMEVGFRLN